MGVTLIGADSRDGRFDLRDVIKTLKTKYDIATILVEAGPRLLGDLFKNHLINEAWVFIAPLLFADEKALSSATSCNLTKVIDSTKFSLNDVRTRGEDVVLRYGVLDSCG